MSAGPSYGSNCNGCSQSKKVSIGVMVDPLPTRGLRFTDGDVLKVPTAAECNTQKGGLSTNGFVATTTVPTEAREQFELWTMKRTAQHSTPSGSYFQAKGTASKDDRNSTEPNGVKGASVLQPLHLFSKQSTKKGKLDRFVDKKSGKETGNEREDAATRDNTKEKLDGFVDRKNGKENEGAATGEKHVFKVSQEIHTSNSRTAAGTGVTTNGKTEVLRMKLMELMATISSPTKSILQPPEVSRTSPQPALTQKLMDDIAPIPCKYSDTIEANSGSPDSTNKRSITQPQPREGISGRMQQERLGHTMQSGSKKKSENQTITSEEGLPGGVQGTSYLSYKTFTRKRNSEKKNGVTIPYNTNVQVQEMKDKIEEVADRNAKLLPAERTLVPSSRLVDTRHKNIRPLGKQSLKEPSKGGLDKQESEKNKPETRELRKHNGQLSSGNVVGPQNDLNSLKTVKRQLREPEPRKVSIQQNENLSQQEINENQNLPPLNKTSSRSFVRGGLPPSYSLIDRKNTATENSPVSINCIEQPVARKLSLQEDTMVPQFQVNKEAAPSLSPHEKSLSHGSIRRRLDKVHPVINNNNTCLNTTVEKKSFKKQGKLSFEEKVNSPASSVNLNPRGDCDQTSEKDSMNPKDVTDKPTSWKSPNVGNSSGSLPDEAEMELEAFSPTLADKMFRRSRIFKFETFSSNISLNNSKKETRMPQDSPFVHPVPHVEEKDAECSSPGSSTDDSESEDSEEDLVSQSRHLDGRKDSSGSEEDAPSPKSIPIEKPKFMLHRAKKLRSYEDTPYEEQNPVSFSPQRSPENILMQETMPQDVEDGVTSAVGMLALALEKLKNKVKLLTNKKSSEILASVAEAMHSQFHNLESQIHTDTSKFTNLSRHKRKRLEAEFQENEEQLKNIHENVRKEINQLLDGCKGTIEGLEENHVELKGVLEKQKTSHWKLLVQAQESVETQLQDAEKRITSINKSAREQMQQLKLVIAECLEEVVRS